MKWVKHQTQTWNDEKIARLVGNGGVDGLAAYGLWWRMVEIVASQVEGKSTQCSVTYPVSRWSVLLSLRGSHVRHWVEKLAVTSLLTAEWTATELRVTIPNLLKYRDEYTRKSGDCQAQRTDIEEKEIKNKNNPIAPLGAVMKSLGWKGPKETPEPVIDAILERRYSEFPEDARLESDCMIYSRLVWFDEFFSLYWRKDDKRSARVAYFKAVKTIELKDEIEEAVIKQTPQMLAKDKKYHPLAATWLNKARWIDPVQLPLEAA